MKCKSARLLSWDEKDPQRDDIWMHLVLQNCRFLKQTIQKLGHYIQVGDKLKAQLQEMIDQGEFEQFRSRGRAGSKLKFLVAFLLLLGSGFWFIQHAGVVGTGLVSDPAVVTAEPAPVEAVALAGQDAHTADGAQFISQTTSGEGELLRYLQAVEHGVPTNMLAPPAYEGVQGQQNVVHGQNGRHFVSDKP